MAETQPVLTAAQFALDPFEASIFAGFATGENWNGWAVPYFTFAEASRLCEFNNRLAGCGTLSYDAANDMFVLHDPEFPEEQSEFRSVMFDGQKLYSVGGMSWCWTIAHPAQPPRSKTNHWPKILRRKPANGTRA